jgi:hypothetical protein
VGIENLEPFSSHEAKGLFRIEATEEHGLSEPLTDAGRFLVRLDTEEQKPAWSQPLVKLGEQTRVFLSREVVEYEPTTASNERGGNSSSIASA